MLKKICIVATTTVAALIGLSPMAFASGDGDYHHHDYDFRHYDYDDYDDYEVINILIRDESVERNQINRCEFEQEVEVPGALEPITVTQTQSGNCTNAGDDT